MKYIHFESIYQSGYQRSNIHPRIDNWRKSVKNRASKINELDA